MDTEPMGIDTSENEPQESKKEEKPTTNQQRLSLLKSRLSVAKAFSKKPHDTWKKWIKEYDIDDFDVPENIEDIRDRVRIGYIFRKTESELPAIFDDQPEIFIKGRKSNVKDIEPLIEGTYDYLWDIQNLEEIIENAGLYFEVVGMAFIESIWKTKIKNVQEPVMGPVIDPQTGQPQIDPQTGQPTMQPVIDSQTGQPQMKTYSTYVVDNPQAETVDPFKLHFSPETVFAPVLDYEHCPYYFRDVSLSEEEIEAKYGKEVEATGQMSTEDADLNDELAKMKDVHEDDIKRVDAHHYWGCLPEEMAKDITDEQGNAVEWEYDKDYHVLFTDNEELLAEENPYDTKPLFPIGSYGLANKFWKFGDVKHLMPLVKELEKYRSQILNHTRKMANPKPLIPETANVDEKNFYDPRTGKVVKYAGTIPPSYLSPAPLGREVQVGVDMVRTDLEKTAGSFDLENGGGQSTVKTPRGIQVFSEASDKNTRRKRKKIARLIRQLLIFQFKQIAKYWKPEDEKTLNVITPDGPQDVKVTSEVLQVLNAVNIMYNLDIEVESLAINRAQQKQDALDLFDLAAQHPDVFNLQECAKDLLQNGYNKKDADRYLLTDQQRQALASNKQPPSTSVNVKVDSSTPTGLQLLENFGLIEQGQAQQLIAAQQATAAIQNQPLLDAGGQPAQPQTPQIGGVAQ
jgi:hypothetical protein